VKIVPLGVFGYLDCRRSAVATVPSPNVSVARLASSAKPRRSDWRWTATRRPWGGLGGPLVRLARREVQRIA
jgi:hypothetical protein